jgi:chromosome segregation ATPase
MTDIVEYPEWVMLRDTMLHDDMGGLGQRIYTSSGSGYTKQKYIRADVVEALHQQLAIKDDALRDAKATVETWLVDNKEKFEELEQQLAELKAEMKIDAEGPDWIQRAMQAEASEDVLKEQLVELEDDEQKAVERCVIAEQKLAECQEQKKYLEDAMRTHNTALDTLDAIRKRRWQREALLEAVNRLNPGYEDYEWRWVVDELNSMAKELE